MTHIDSEPPDLADDPYEQEEVPRDDPGGASYDQYFSEDPGMYLKNEY